MSGRNALADPRPCRRLFRWDALAQPQRVAEVGKDYFWEYPGPGKLPQHPRFELATRLNGPSRLSQLCYFDWNPEQLRNFFLDVNNQFGLS